MFAIINSFCFCCASCGENIIYFHSHSYSEWIEVDEFQHKKVCSCGEGIFENHQWEIDLVNSIPASHVSEGNNLYICPSCKADKNESVEKIKEHEYGDWINEIPAGSDSAGEKGHYECSCGKYFDSNFQEITDLLIPAIGHGKITEYQEIPASCTESGMKAYYICASGCKHFADSGDKVLNDKDLIISKKGHSTVLIKGQAATDTKDGWKDYFQCERCLAYFEDAEAQKCILDIEEWKQNEGRDDGTNWRNPV